MQPRALYTNLTANRTALSFFATHAGCAVARLACPFFTTVEPLRILRDAGASEIRLIVRLCYATMPDALEAAAAAPGVSIRFFDSDEFHAKIYILGDVALVGSSNLTRTGLERNREVGVTVHASDAIFDELTRYFETMWSEARILSGDTFERFSRWHSSRFGSVPAEYSDAEVAAPGPIPPIDGPVQLFARMSIGEASVEQLKRIGKPQNAKAIRLALVKDNYPLGGTTEKEQYRRVTKALRVRERTSGDVLRMGPGQWALAAWYTEQEADQLRFRSANPVQQDHINLTKVGMLAAKAKGKQIGARLKLTPAMVDQAIQMSNDGTAVSAIARFFGVTRMTILTSFQRHGYQHVRRPKAPRMARRPRKKVANVGAGGEPSPPTGN